MNSPHEHFITLCNLWCEEQLSSDQSTELQTLLRSDHALRATFVEFVQLHGQLAWDAGIGVGSQLANEVPGSPVDWAFVKPRDSAPGQLQLLPLVSYWQASRRSIFVA
jgi:hypothetical protein